MKRHSIILGILLGVGMFFKPPLEVSANSNDKACVYTVDIPGVVTMHCYGQGSMCSYLLACPTINIPKT
jgi:hypothetical protein